MQIEEGKWGGVTNVNEIMEVTCEEIHAIRSRGSKNKGGEGSASNIGGVVTREGGGWTKLGAN